MEHSETARASGKDVASGNPVRVTRDGSVVTLTLARPDVRNALSIAMMDAIESALADIAADPSIKVVILAADGPVFCAGHDLKELTARRSDVDGGKAFYAQPMQQCSRIMQAIVTLPQPVIAAVHAPATAAGCQLVATCDLAVAADTARFCTPGVNIGLFCSTPMVALSRNVSRKRAMEMLLLGEWLEAQDARDWGLVNRVVDESDVMAEAEGLADRIAAKSGRTVRIGKQAFYRQIEQSLAEAYDFAADVMVTNMLDRDAVEGIGAFVEKRAPRWSDTDGHGRSEGSNGQAMTDGDDG